MEQRHVNFALNSSPTPTPSRPPLLHGSQVPGPWPTHFETHLNQFPAFYPTFGSQYLPLGSSVFPPCYICALLNGQGLLFGTPHPTYPYLASPPTFQFPNPAAWQDPSPIKLATPVGPSNQGFVTLTESTSPKISPASLLPQTIKSSQSRNPPSEKSIATLPQSQDQSPRSSQHQPFSGLFQPDPAPPGDLGTPEPSGLVPWAANQTQPKSLKNTASRYIRRTRRGRRIKKRRNQVPNPLDEIVKVCLPHEKPTVRYLSGKGIFGAVRQATLSNLPEAANHIEQLQRKQIRRIGSNLRNAWGNREPLAMHIFLRKSFLQGVEPAAKSFLFKQMDFSALQLYAVSAK